MKKLIFTLAVATLTGCAAPKPFVNMAGKPPTQQEIAECDFEAMKATASIASGLEQGWMRSEIRKKCLNVKGYK